MAGHTSSPQSYVTTPHMPTELNFAFPSPACTRSTRNSDIEILTCTKTHPTILFRREGCNLRMTQLLHVVSHLCVFLVVLHIVWALLYRFSSFLVLASCVPTALYLPLHVPHTLAVPDSDLHDSILSLFHSECCRYMASSFVAVEFQNML